MTEEEMIEKIKSMLDWKIEAVMKQPYKFKDILNDDALKENQYVKGSLEFWYNDLSNQGKKAVETIIGIAYVTGQVRMSALFPEIFTTIGEIIQQGE